jgi:hypothetical protein
MGKALIALEIAGATDGLFSFQRDGFDHKLLEQDGPVCLVERTKKGRQLHHEVVVLQFRPEACFPNGKSTPAHWAYPKSEHWGTCGWTDTDLARARRQYAQLAQKWASKASPDAVDRGGGEDSLEVGGLS